MDQRVHRSVSAVLWVLGAAGKGGQRGVALCCLGKCSCLSHQKGKQGSLARCEITCTAWFCSAVFCEERMCLQGGFSVNGVAEGFALLRWLGCGAAGGGDTGCSSGCHAASWRCETFSGGLSCCNQCGLSGNEWLQRSFEVKASVTVKVALGDWSSLAAAGSVFWALAVTLDVHGLAMRAADKLQKSWVDVWPLTLFNSGYFFFFFEEGRRRCREFPATTLFRSLFESVLNKGHQKLRYKATFWS